MSQNPSDPSVNDPFSTRPSDSADPYGGETPTYGEGTSGYGGGTSSYEGASSLGGGYSTEQGGESSPKVDQAKEQGRQVAESAKTEVGNVADTAKSEVSRVTGEAKAQTQNLVSEARGQLREQAQSQTQRAAGLARGLAENFQALTEGRTDEAGPLGQYAQQATEQVQRFADSIEQRGFDGLVQDVQSFARRRPGAFLLTAGLAGFLTGRLVRGARDAQSSDGDGYQQVSGYSGGYSTGRTDYVDDYATTPRVTAPTSAGLSTPGYGTTEPVSDAPYGGSGLRSPEEY